MATIGLAGNAETACLQLMLSKGYTVSCTTEEVLRPVDQFAPKRNHYVAAKDGETFASGDIVSLLGLITLWENYGNEWQEKGLGNQKSDDVWDKIEYTE